MSALKAFFLGHPGIVKAIEGLEHAGLDGAEDLVLTAIGAKFGVLAHLFPVSSILDGIKGKAESAIDGELEKLITPDGPAAAPAAPPVAAPPPAAVPADPRMAAYQRQRAEQLAKVQNPEAARDEQAANPGT